MTVPEETTAERNGPRKTPLFKCHLALGARMMEFGGWSMPLQYSGIVEEHRATRSAAAVFDTCHMGEVDVEGPQALEFLERTTIRKLGDLPPRRIRLSVITNERGGIIDDLTIYRFAEDRFRLVINASTRERAVGWLRDVKEKEGFTGATVTDRTDETGKIDLQGPRSGEILRSITGIDPGLRYYNFLERDIEGIPVVLSRSGYTGEDGYEIYMPWEKTLFFWELFLERGKDLGIRPAGLGARDTLRLEAGMMLYGHELCEEVTPLEVVYGKFVALDGGFIGVGLLREEMKAGPRKTLIGFEMTGRGIPRQGHSVLSGGRKVGTVTSGTFGITVQKAIGMAFVRPEHSQRGEVLDIEIREKPVPARVVDLPFYSRKKG
jgi:aminomethyltransferase